MKSVLFISSGGGHLSELMQLESLFKKYRYHIVTEKTESTLYLRKKYYKKIDYLVFGTKKKLFLYFFKFFFNILKSFVIFIKFKPDVIITTGTHTAVPMCYIGKAFRKKIIYIESFANVNTKSLAGRIVYRISDLFIVQWKGMLELYDKVIFGGWIY